MGAADRVLVSASAAAPTGSTNNSGIGANVGVAESVTRSSSAATSTLEENAAEKPTRRDGTGVLEVFSYTIFARTSDLSTTLARMR